MPEYAAEKQIRLQTERAVARATDAAAVQRRALETTIAEQAETIATLEAKVAQHDTKIEELDGKVAAAEAKP